MSDEQSEAVVLLSGGLDSMVVAGLARERGVRLNALTIDYNQRHRKEIWAARKIAEHLEVAQHAVLPLNLRVFGGSALTSDLDVPKQGVQSGIPSTYVPARNLVFLSIAVAWAEALGVTEIHIGVNALDYSGYPDCRPKFIESFASTAILATRQGVEGEGFAIIAPLQNWGKARIAAECIRMDLDPAISWSCYDPVPDGRACGVCDSCRLRRQGFAAADLVDTTAYAE